MKRVKITSIDKVSGSKSDSSSSGGRSFEPSAGGGTGTPSPGGMGGGSSFDPREAIGGDEPEEKEAGPGRRTLSEEEKLPDEFVDRIDTALQDRDWDQGGVPMQGEAGPDSDGEQDSPVKTGQPASPVDERIWSKTPAELEKEIEEATKRGLQNEAEEETKRQKEENAQTEKTIGGKGKGKGTVRDRLRIENLSRTDWAGIFKSRLSAYSSEKGSYLPYNRRFVAGRRMPTSRLPDKTKAKDVLPVLNLIVDTSSSLGKRELMTILGEISVALSSAKIKNLNLILWHHQAYYHKEFTDVNSKNFNNVINDMMDNWEGGGNDDVALLEKIKALGWSKNFSISLTDGYIGDYVTSGSKLYTLAKEVFDPQNTIFGIIFPNKAMPYRTWQEMVARFPGEKVPIFLESAKFER